MVRVYWALACSLFVCSCGKGEADTDTQTTGTTAGETSDTTEAPTAGPETEGSTTGDIPGCNDGQSICIAPQREVDVLFVIDNSFSMAEEQALLSANIEAFIATLEGAGADYRIAVTTTDMGNPRCQGSAEFGEFVSSSCLGRLNEFVIDNPPINATATCDGYCIFDDNALMLSPTPIAEGGTAPRAWIERFGAGTNLPEGIQASQALQCFAPQGIAGCGYESTLESMYRALLQSSSPESPNYGFLRDTAILQVVILTDELDCSYNPDFSDIFVSNQVFWNPGDMFPTSSACFRAGVACQNPGPDLGECQAQDHDIQGNPTDNPDEAVLHPVSRYTDLLRQIEIDRQTINAGAEVHVSVIAGVPSGYPGSDIVYTQNGATQEFLDLYGIAPGCTSPAGGEALPPVRLREFAEFFAIDGKPNMFSICDDDYTPALQAIAEAIGDNLAPACVPECIADTDPNTAVLEPNCTFYNTDANNEVSEVPACVAEGEQLIPPPGETLCYHALTDKSGATPSTADDLSDRCIDSGWNLEIVTVNSDPSTRVQLTYNCELSADIANDCPGL